MIELQNTGFELQPVTNHVPRSLTLLSLTYPLPPSLPPSLSPSLPHSRTAVRERLDRLELLTEKERGSADNTADSANTSAVAVETTQTSLPQMIMKIKNNSMSIKRENYLCI